MKKMLALGVLAMVLFLTVPVQAQDWNGPWGYENYRQHGQCGQGRRPVQRLRLSTGAQMGS